MYHLDDIELADLELVLSEVGSDSGRILVSSWALNPPSTLVTQKWDVDPQLEEKKRHLLTEYSDNMSIVHDDSIQTIYQVIKSP